MKSIMKKVPTAVVVLGAFMPAILFIENALGEVLPKVTVAVASSTKVVNRVPFAGTFVARQEVHVNAQLSGVQIQQIHVEIGDVVSAGDVLIELDSQVLENDLAQIDTEVIRAEASIRRTRHQISASEATVTTATNALQRNTQLHKSNDISQSILDDSIGAADNAAALWAIAREELAIAQAEHVQLLAKREMVVLKLSRSIITASANGLIVATNAHIGAMVNPGGEPLLTLIVNGEVELEAEVIESGLPKIRIGDQAQITLADGTQQLGEIRLISPTVDSYSRLGLIKVSLSNSANIRIGSFAHGWLTGSEYEALVIPNSAVQSHATGDSITVVTNGVIEKRAVVIGIVHQEQREILEGLAKGEQVLVRAGSFYQNGDHVSTLESISITAPTPIEAAQLQTSGEVL